MCTAKQQLRSEDTAKGKQGNSPFFSRNVIQAKLQVNEPGDSHEREADAMAEQVMRMSDTQALNNSFFKPSAAAIQRKCEHCEEEDKKIKGEESTRSTVIQRKCQHCEDEEKLQRKENGSGAINAGSGLDNYVSTLSSSGQALSAKDRQFFEPRFGQDFSNVRIHTDTGAARSAQSINALAYTTGNHIVFNTGQYSPESDKGKKLIAHELTHVVQQGSSVATKRIQRMGDPSKIPPMACDVANSSPGSSVLSARFPLSSSDLTPAQRKDIAALVASWQASGAADILRVDGYASNPGTDELNWQLSCARALSVANELRNNGVPDALISIFAQGETNEFGSQANNQVANVSIIGAPRPAAPSVITSETVELLPAPRDRKKVAVGEEVNLTLSSGDATTAWTTTAGTLSATTGPTVKFTAPDTAQNVIITAGGANIVFTIVAPSGVHMDRFTGTGVKHTQNQPDSGIEILPFILPDTVNFSKIRYREIDVKGIVSSPGVYSCNPASNGHCGHGGTAPCNDLAVTNTVVAGKGTQTVLGDCAYSGHCGFAPPFTSGLLVLFIPYEYKVGTGAFRQFTLVVQSHSLAADGSTLTTSKADASGSTTVASATLLIPACP